MSVDFNVDTGDSFLSQIDNLMGPPPLDNKKGKGSQDKGGGSGSLLQGIMQALGIGNKPLADKPADKPAETPAVTATQEPVPTGTAGLPTVQEGLPPLDQFMPGRNPNEDLILHLQGLLAPGKK